MRAIAGTSSSTRGWVASHSSSSSQSSRKRRFHKVQPSVACEYADRFEQIVEGRGADPQQLRLASARDTLLRVRSATFDNLFEAISVFASDGRLYLWNRRFLEDWELDEEWLSTHPRVDELVPAMARKLVNPTAAAQIREMVRQTTNERESASGRISMTDGRHFQFAAVPLPDGNALFTMVDVTDFDAHRGSASRTRDRA